MLESSTHNWMTDLIMTCDQFYFHIIDAEEFGCSQLPNPYQLSKTDKADVVFISTNFYNWSKDHMKVDIQNFYEKLRKVANKIIGIEGFDTFSLGLPPDAFNHIDLLLKGQGIYKDKELYNYRVGTLYPGANWNIKKSTLNNVYANEHLDKIRISFPCFVGINASVRRKTRKIRKEINIFNRILRNMGDVCSDATNALIHFVKSPHHTTHCIGSLSHLQRLELVKLLKSNNITGKYGITKVPNYIWGTAYLNSSLPTAMRHKYMDELKTIDALVPRLNRIVYKWTIANSKSVIAPCGYGELSFRLAEGWEQGRIVICQNMSHAEVLFPLLNNQNVIFCERDFSDIIKLLRDIEYNWAYYKQIAQYGKDSWNAWISDYDSILYKGLLQYLKIN